MSNSEQQEAGIPPKKKPEEYSKNPHTIRARARMASLDPYRRMAEHARAGDVKAVARAQKIRCDTDSFKVMTPEQRRACLESEKEKVMARRKRRGCDYDSKLKRWNERNAGHSTTSQASESNPPSPSLNRASSTSGFDSEDISKNSFRPKNNELAPSTRSTIINGSNLGNSNANGSLDFTRTLVSGHHRSIGSTPRNSAPAAPYQDPVSSATTVADFEDPMDLENRWVTSAIEYEQPRNLSTRGMPSNTHVSSNGMRSTDQSPVVNTHQPAWSGSFMGAARMMHHSQNLHAKEKPTTDQQENYTAGQEHKDAQVSYDPFRASTPNNYNLGAQDVGEYAETAQERTLREMEELRKEMARITESNALVMAGLHDVNARLSEEKKALRLEVLKLKARVQTLECSQALSGSPAIGNSKASDVLGVPAAGL